MDALYLILILAVSATSAVAAFVYGKRSPRIGKILVGIGFTLLLATLLSRIVPAYFSGLQPASLMAECLYGLSFVFVGGIASRFRRTFRERMLHDVMTLLLAYFVVADAAYLAFRADAVKALSGRVSQGVTMQSTGFTCAPSSMTTVLRLWGIECTEGQAAYAMRTSFRGTTLARAPQAIATLGADRNLQAKIVYTDFDELAKFDVPVLLSTYYGSVHHSSALIGLQGQKVAAGEPTNGLLLSSREAYLRDWRWRGQAVVIAPDFLHTFTVNDDSPRARELFATMARLGYPRTPEGIAKFNRDHGLNADRRLDWRGILVLDASAAGPNRPKLSTFAAFAAEDPESAPGPLANDAPPAQTP